MKAADLLEQIRTDRTSGATALAERALEALSRSPSSAGALLKLRPGLPLIAAVTRLARRSGPAAALRALRAARAKILERALEILPPGGRYAFFGDSGTVRAVLEAVGALEPGSSRPDVALVGADAILPGGDFVNAAGTARFLRKVREQRAGVFVVATDLKRVKTPPPLEPGFERVPAHLVHGILTESGVHHSPTGPVPEVEPAWLDRGALNPLGERGLCHPHHRPRTAR